VGQVQPKGALSSAAATHVLFFPQQCTYIDNNYQPTDNGRLFNEFNASRKWKKSLLLCHPLNFVAILFRRTHTFWVRAREDERAACTLPLSLYMCVCIFRFSPFRTRAAAPSLGAVHIFYFALDGLISLSSSRLLFMVPYIYIPAALQLLFSALCPPRKIRPWRWEKGQRARVDLQGDN
jgi:hypothetical protein